MRCSSRPIAALLILALQAFAGGAAAGPVSAGEATDGTADASTAPALSARLLNESVAATAAASAASGSALAVEIIKEAEAGTAAVEAPREPRREGARPAAQPTTSSPSTRPPVSTADDPWGLRDMGKTAVQWVKGAIPWLRSDEDTPDASKNLTLDAADWSGSPLEGGQPGRGGRPVSNPPLVAGQGGDPLSSVGYGDPSRPKVAPLEENIVRVVINVLREVLEHPMTWLVISLFVIGGIVVKRIDRRPTK